MFKSRPSSINNTGCFEQQTTHTSTTQTSISAPHAHFIISNPHFITTVSPLIENNRNNHIIEILYLLSVKGRPLSEKRVPFLYVCKPT